MKRELLVAALGAAVVSAAPVALAKDKGPTVYGQLDVSLNHTTDEVAGTDTSKNVNFTSNASRLGVKGKKQLNDSGLHAVYKLEYEVDVTDSDFVFKQRSIYTGLKGDFGTVTVGTQDTPTKKVQGGIDLFGESPADIKFISSIEKRSKNSIQYKSPKIADAITVKFMAQAVEQDGVTAGQDENGLFDSTSSSVQFEQGPLYAAVSVDDNMENKGKQGLGGQSALYFEDRIVVALGYAADLFQVGFLYEEADQGDQGPNDLSAYVINGGFATSDNTFVRAQYMANEIEDGATGNPVSEVSVLAFGADLSLAENTSLYTNLILSEEDISDAEQTEFEVGIFHKF